MRHSFLYFFRWYAFPNFSTQISRPLACGVRISSKASATAGTYLPFVSRSCRKGAKAAALLCPLLGVTWVVAFLNFSGTLLITEYLFTILNSMQVKRAGESGLIYGTGWRNSAQGVGLEKRGQGEVGGFRCWLNWDSEEVCRVRIVIGDSKSETIFWRKSVMSIHPSRISLIDPVFPFRDAWSSSSTLFATLRWVGGELMSLCRLSFRSLWGAMLLACQSLRYWG